jgi:hypothetical protein
VFCRLKFMWVSDQGPPLEAPWRTNGQHRALQTCPEDPLPQISRVCSAQGRWRTCLATDRGRLGTKRHLVVDAHGTPLGVTLGGASRHYSMVLAPSLSAIPPIRLGKRARPRRRPQKLHGDNACESRRCRAECRARGIKARFAHGAGTASSSPDATAGSWSAPTPGCRACDP